LEYIKSLSDNEQAEIFVAIEKLIFYKNNNLRIPDKLSKCISNGIFELKVKHENRVSRCLYFFGKEYKLVFTNGFIEKQQKTPIIEIEKAIKIKNEYESEKQ